MPDKRNILADHLLEWLIPHRIQLISFRRMDALAGRPIGTFSRFVKRQPGFTFTRASLEPYYPFLALLGYQPPTLNP